MKSLSLKSIKRKLAGKGKARSLRREGMVPSILYGPNQSPIKLSVNLKDFESVIKEGKTSQFLLDLYVDEVIKKVTIKEIQKHPVTSDILHIDFYEVIMDRKIKVLVPISTIGKSKGVELGGIIQIVRRELEVLCFPNKIPKSIDIDISNLDIGNSFHVMDLIISDEIEIINETNFTILTVLSQRSSSHDESKEDDTDKDKEPAEKIESK